MQDGAPIQYAALSLRNWRNAFLASVESLEDSGGQVFLRVFSAPSENTRIEDCREIAEVAAVPRRLLHEGRQQCVYLWRRIDVKAQVEQLTKMSETLESSGFTRLQANAVIESVALAMETFTVTPEILDDRIDGLREEMNARFAAQGEDIKDIRKSVDRLEQNILEFQQNMLKFQRSILGHQRSIIRYMLAFVLLMLGAVVGIFGAIFSQLFVA